MRCLFVGLGSTGQRHLRNLATLLGPDLEPWAYRVRGERRVLDDRQHVVPDADLVERHGLRTFDRLEDALAAGPEVVLVCNPTSEHVPVASLAARHGCDLFLEKPLGQDLCGVAELVAEVEARGLVALLGQQLRWHPGFRRVREVLDAGMLGRVVHVHAEVGEYLPGYHPYEDYRRSYAARRDLGGGVVRTQIHELDLVYALFGLPRRVFSLGGHRSSLEVDVEDVSSSLMDFVDPGGLPFSVHLHQDYLQRPARRELRVLGDQGQLQWDLVLQSLTRLDANGAVAERHDYAELPRNRLFLDEMRHFLECVRTRAAPAVTLRDGAATLEIALALLRSQDGGQPEVPEKGWHANQARSAGPDPRPGWVQVGTA